MRGDICAAGARISYAGGGHQGTELMTDRFREVSKDELTAWLKAYPRPLEIANETL